MLWKSKLEVIIQRYPKKKNKLITYGTAGFRSKAEELDYVMLRMGILAALRSIDKKGAAIGVMITASHNPECDNGVKLIDPLGEMLQASWEIVATELANCEDSDLVNWVAKWLNKLPSKIQAKVMIARDTRSSSEFLSGAVLAGAELLDAVVINHGVTTTPMLHYFVAGYNKGTLTSNYEEQYFTTISGPFNKLRADVSRSGNYVPELIFDGANGVGAIAMKSFMEKIKNLTVTICNDDLTSKGKLNHLCGSDYVKTGQCIATGITVNKGDRCCSADGDCDRLIYYYIDDGGTFRLLDGDRIASLIAGFLKGLVTECGLDLNLGLVQTAYANGNSTKYMTQQLKISVACVDTGVKYLHHKAEEFDIGIYFEANGHGTVLFSEKAHLAINTAAASGSECSYKLKMLKDMVNSAVGDAMSDLLLVESILLLKGWSCDDWFRTYKDLPNRLVKITVQDRNSVVTTDAARKCVKPDGLQTEIDALVAKYPSGRSFVRPSGTEDVVRVYAEAETQEVADSLASAVSAIVYKMASGVGDPPEVLPVPPCVL